MVFSLWIVFLAAAEAITTTFELLSRTPILKFYTPICAHFRSSRYSRLIWAIDCYTHSRHLHSNLYLRSPLELLPHCSCWCCLHSISISTLRGWLVAATKLSPHSSGSCCPPWISFHSLRFVFLAAAGAVTTPLRLLSPTLSPELFFSKLWSSTWLEPSPHYLGCCRHHPVSVFFHSNVYSSAPLCYHCTDQAGVRYTHIQTFHSKLCSSSSQNFHNSV